MLLNDDAVRKINAGNKAAKYFDGKGMYLLVTPNGSKYWRFKYRFEGKERLLSLGVHPKVSLSDARLQCNEARQLLKKGIDPSMIRKEQKAREKSEHTSVGQVPSVRVNMDGMVEIWKGSTVLALSIEEVDFIKTLLIKLSS